MSRSRSAPRSLTLGALLLLLSGGWSARSAPSSAFAGETLRSEAPFTVGGGPEKASAYREFAADGRGSFLMTIVRRIYRSTAEAAEVYPVDPAGATGRPAGPRDEPPPPEWPERPEGLVLCLRVAGKVRACEGEMAAPHQDLGTAASVLAERLPLSRSRGKPKVLTGAERDAASLEAVFALSVPVAAGDEEEAATPGPPEGIDPASAGIRVTGSRGEVFLLPGEAASTRRALRAARKAGAIPRFGGEAKVAWFVAVPAGTIPLVAP